jgi:polyhydroxyalkanoate synthesis regulator phasin
MNERETIVAGSSDSSWFRRVSWGGIFAGALVAIGIQILLGFLGAAIGLAAIDPTSPGGFTIGAAIWLIFSGIIALFGGGWVAGRLTGERFKMDRALNGLVVWALTIILTLYLITTTAMTIIGGALGFVQTSVVAAGQVAQAAGPQIGQYIQQQFGGPGSPLGQLQAEVEQLFEQTTDTLQSPQARQELQKDVQTVLSALNRLVTEGKISQQTQQQVQQILVERGDMSQQQAEEMLNEWIQTSKDIRQQAMAQADSLTKAAENAADVVAATSGWIFFILLLDAVAAVAGAVVGSPQPKR